MVPMRLVSALACSVVVLLACGRETSISSDGEARIGSALPATGKGWTFDPGAVIHRATNSFVASGEKYVRVAPSHEAVVMAGELHFEPATGKRGCAGEDITAPRATPLMLRTTSISRGTELADYGAVAHLDGSTGAVRVQHRSASAVEWIRATREGVQQSWEFPEAPQGTGDLRVEVSFGGQDYIESSDRGLHFRDKRTGLGVWYGHGTWIDANGLKVSVPAVVQGERIALVVSESVLKASTFPAVLDPDV